MLFLEGIEREEPFGGSFLSVVSSRTTAPGVRLGAGLLLLFTVRVRSLVVVRPVSRVRHLRAGPERTAERTRPRTRPLSTEWGSLPDFVKQAALTAQQRKKKEVPERQETSTEVSPKKWQIKHLEDSKRCTALRVMTETVTSEDLPSALVELTTNEADLVDVLVEAAKETETTVRICGGWVRDKALGRVTKDIDVALDNCSGAAFAQKVATVVSKKNSVGGVSHIGVIAANPDQSKHLETATMKLCGVEVDFVNLRSEAYADDNSRVPTTVDFGTPLQDASRRDFTVNALMFNVHTRTIEDHTGQGWNDLRAGLLRTPLEPKITLLDDPLRALRGVRFAARYGFALDDAFRDACRDPQVKAAFLTKVSRERVGKETKGAFSATARGCVRAMDELRRLNLASSALRAVTAVGYEGDVQALNLLDGDGALTSIPCAAVFSEEDKEDQGGGSPWVYASRCVAAHAAVAFPGPAMDDATTFQAPRRTSENAVVALAAALIPFAACTALGTSSKRHAPLPVAVCREGLKLPNTDVNAVHKVLDAVPRARDLAHRVVQNDATLRRDVGIFLYDLKDLWRDAVNLARAADLAAGPGWDGLDLDLDNAVVRRVVEHYAAFIDAINDPHRLNLTDIWDTLTPFYSGNDLIREFTMPKGPTIGLLLDEQRNFQLTNPDADRSACRSHLAAHYDTLRARCGGSLPQQHQHNSRHQSKKKKPRTHSH